MTIFTDQVHIERIAEALWRRSPLGNAALMIGAGLSLNARNIADPGRQMPTWSDLAENLCEKLYPSSDKYISPRQRDHALKKVSTTSGALRLAQEFEASFGRTELNRLLKNFVPDDDFAPSDLHENILKLPWADVFTTNWDTLLERAVDYIVDRRYDIVRTREDIPASQQPRIIKLHGSFPSNHPFIFSEEDYRRYPTNFAHFVNMVQQSMMENLFCLIGFSGDDPNFLHWAGWVRDNLGKSAPKIYLVGWLDLAPVQRRVLEDRNVVPVDLSRLPQGSIWKEDCRHCYALEWFLWMLKLRRPSINDTPTLWQKDKQQPPEYLEIELSEFDVEKPEKLHSPLIYGPNKETERLEELQGQIPIWRDERSNYEGWVIAPRRVRSNFWSYTQNWVKAVAQLAHLMPPWERLFTLREIVWRLDVCLAPLFGGINETLAQTLNDIDPNEQKCFTDGQEVTWTKPDWMQGRNAWFEVAIALLRHYRIEGLTDQFEPLAQRIEKLKGCKHSLDAVAYQRAILFLQRMDYAAVKTISHQWQVERSDHVWAIRKAGILFELGEFDIAYELLTTTLPAIRRSIRRDSDDYAALSREGCAMQLIEIAEWEKRFRGTDPQEEQNKNYTNNPDWVARWKTLLAKDCDIRDEWQSLRALLDASTPDPRTDREIRERGFDLGRVSIGRHFTSGGRYLPAFQALAFTETAGMPPIISSGGGGVAVGSTGLKMVAIWLKDVDTEMAIKILMRICISERDEALKKITTRETVAQLDKDFVSDFVEILLHAIGEIANTISADKTFLNKLIVGMEILSRLTLRLTDARKHKQVFDLAITLAHNPAVSKAWGLEEPLSNLLKRAIECFEKNAQSELILPLLKLPTHGIEKSAFGGEPWWGYFSNLDEEVAHSLRNSWPEGWKEVIRFLLAEAAKRESRRRAVWRLTFLHCSKLLTKQEQQAFAKKLWTKGFLSSTGLPGETDLNPWVFLDLPASEEGKVERLIRAAYLTNEGAEKVTLAGHLKELGDFLNVMRERNQTFALSPEEVSVIETKVMDWAKEAYSSPQHIFASLDTETEITKIDGVAKLLPFVPLETHDLSLIAAHIDVLESDQISCYQLYPPLIAHQPDQPDDLTNRLKAGIAGDNINSASKAIYALRYWLSLAETDHAAPPPDALIEEVGLTIYMRRETVLAAALQFAAFMFKKHSELAARTIAERTLLGLGNLIATCDFKNSFASGLADRVDIPLIRYACTNLALTMSKAGYFDHDSIKQWIEAAKEDPLPEVRNLIDEK